MVHGLGIGDIGKVVLEDRTALGKEGIVAVTILVDRNGKVIKKPEMTSRGFVYEQKYGGIINDASNNLFKNLNERRARNAGELKGAAESFLEKYFFDKTRRSPMILPVVVEV
jgi:ribonuclease J